jgi:hypothetical protein
VFLALLSVSEMLPQEFNQFLFTEEPGLCPRIHFLHDALQLAALPDLPKLNYKRSSHDEIRVLSSYRPRVEISWS